MATTPHPTAPALYTNPIGALLGVKPAARATVIDIADIDTVGKALRVMNTHTVRALPVFRVAQHQHKYPTELVDTGGKDYVAIFSVYDLMRYSNFALLPNNPDSLPAFLDTKVADIVAQGLGLYPFLTTDNLLATLDVLKLERWLLLRDEGNPANVNVVSQSDFIKVTTGIYCTLHHCLFLTAMTPHRPHLIDLKYLHANISSLPDAALKRTAKDIMGVVHASYALADDPAQPLPPSGATSFDEARKRYRIYVHPDLSAMQAFKTMARHRVSAVAICTSERILIANLSCTDLIPILGGLENGDQALQAVCSMLDEPVGKLIRVLRGVPADSATTTGIAETLGQGGTAAALYVLAIDEETNVADMLDYLVNSATGAHHLWVVDAQKRLVGNVSLSDIIHVFTPTGTTVVED